MTSQSEYEKNKAAAAATAKALENARAYQKTKDDAKKKVKSLNQEIRAIQVFEIDKNKEYIKKYEEDVAARVIAYNNQYKARLPHDAGDIDALTNNLYYGTKTVDAFKAQIAKWTAEAKASVAKIAKLKKQVAEQEKIANKLYTPMKPTVIVPPAAKAKTKTVEKTKGDSSSGGLVDSKFSVGYKYNAPMVSSAYFGKGLQGDTVANSPFTTIKPDQFAYYNAYAQQAYQDGLYTTGVMDFEPSSAIIDMAAFTDARDTWYGTRGGRGVLQMDQIFTQALESDKTGQLDYKNTLSKSTVFDRQLYGFKFLYNPTTVSMAWDINDKMDPPYMASGKDPFNIISTGLMSSTVGFELLLNRIDDLNHLNEYGEMRNDINPYPMDVPIEDRKELWRKGTMYDLEYLFKTINGPNATFTSSLNGETADRGWLRPTIMELHLGKSLRYRVRLASLQVNHIIFTKEMVPTLTKLTIVAKRMVDGDFNITKAKD